MSPGPRPATQGQPDSLQGTSISHGFCLLLNVTRHMHRPTWHRVGSGKATTREAKPAAGTNPGPTPVCQPAGGPEAGCQLLSPCAGRVPSLASAAARAPLTQQQTPSSTPVTADP